MELRFMEHDDNIWKNYSNRTF